jgi:Tfp pilus assembly PilM family ATPase
MVHNNIQDTALLAQLLRELTRPLVPAGRQVVLVLPDRVAKVSLVTLETAPRSQEETRDLLIWKLKKATPFRVEEGRLSYQPFPTNGSGGRYLVTFAHNTVISEYEQAARAAGLDPCIVDLTTFNLFNLYHDLVAAEAGDGDLLMLNLAADYFAALIARQGIPIFYRCKGLAEGQEVVASVSEEVRPTLLYYQDKLGGTRPAQVLLRGRPDSVESLLDTLRERHGLEATALDAGRVVDLGDLDPYQRDALAPALGAAVGR